MKKLLSVTFFSALLTLVKMGSGFIIAKVVAVYTGPSGMAMLGQIQSIVASLNGIVNAPVSSCIVRYTAENEKQGISACSPWWKASVWWLCCIQLVVMPLGVVFSEQISLWLLGTADYKWLICSATIALPLVSVGTLINSIINGFQQYKFYIGIGALSNIFSCVLMVFLIVYKGIDGALFAATIQAALIGIILMCCALKQPWFKFCYLWGRVDKYHKKKVAGYILMAVTTALTAPVALIFVRRILVENVGWEYAGHWQAVWKISEAYLAVITISLSTYYLPKLSSLKNKKEIRAEINKTALMIIPAVGLMALVVYLFRDFAIKILFSNEFSDARKLFAIQLIGDVIKIASWLYAYPMLSRGSTVWYVSSEIVFSITFVILVFILVPHYYTQGANIAYLINYMFYFLFLYLNLERYAK
ncbi:O-antigen translocase [Candidatus Symbiopectobacterium sp. NZEC151]|uniref:O-antigen translocase n=1 Tax=Candidatus Symbiopectobacterium sp. NZEC151 TaxID=2820470 RepID=UPI002227CDDA|nr:O-antigen translocase [Candidatus Symbiopectobacterium sp. NZEC151]MCW2473045.1 O-antigen translocase [Candidatus Symbiopectobacterium sp. NZEC151]